jgi:hypothetical protein
MLLGKVLLGEPKRSHSSVIQWRETRVSFLPLPHHCDPGVWIGFRRHSPNWRQKTTDLNYRKNQWEGKKALARLASGFTFLVANPEFYSHLASWRVVIRTPAVTISTAKDLWSAVVSRRLEVFGAPCHCGSVRRLVSTRVTTTRIFQWHDSWSVSTATQPCKGWRQFKSQAKATTR